MILGNFLFGTLVLSLMKIVKKTKYLSFFTKQIGPDSTFLLCYVEFFSLSHAISIGKRLMFYVYHKSFNITLKFWWWFVRFIWSMLYVIQNNYNIQKQNEKINIFMFRFFFTSLFKTYLLNRYTIFMLYLIQAQNDSWCCGLCSCVLCT